MRLKTRAYGTLFEQIITCFNSYPLRDGLRRTIENNDKESFSVGLNGKGLLTCSSSTNPVAYMFLGEVTLNIFRPVLVSYTCTYIMYMYKPIVCEQYKT